MQAARRARGRAGRQPRRKPSLCQPRKPGNRRHRGARWLRDHPAPQQRPEPPCRRPAGTHGCRGDFSGGRALSAAPGFYVMAGAEPQPNAETKTERPSSSLLRSKRELPAVVRLEFKARLVQRVPVQPGLHRENPCLEKGQEKKSEFK